MKRSSVALLALTGYVSARPWMDGQSAVSRRASIQTGRLTDAESPTWWTKGKSGALLLMVALAATPAAAEDWPSFLGPNRDSRSPETGILVDWKDGGPPLVWQREVGDGYATPVVAGGRLFHVDRAGDRARLVALNATTGAPLWQVETPLEYEDYYGYSNGPRASPVVDGDRVYTHGVDGRLQCRRTEDGALVWEVDTQREFGFVQNFFGVASAPLVEGDLLIVPIGGSPPGSPPIHSGRVTGNRSGLVAFDKQHRQGALEIEQPARELRQPGRPRSCAASVSVSTSRAAACSPSTQRPAPSASSIHGVRRGSRASTRRPRWWSVTKC